MVLVSRTINIYFVWCLVAALNALLEIEMIPNCDNYEFLPVCFLEIW